MRQPTANMTIPLFYFKVFLSILVSLWGTISMFLKETKLALFSSLLPKVGDCEEQLTSADCQPNVNRQLTNSWLTGYEQSTDSLPTVGQLSADSPWWWAVHHKYPKVQNLMIYVTKVKIPLLYLKR